jgi:hypothetical protein
MADPLSALGIAAFAFLSHFAQSEPGKKFIESIVGKLGEKTLEAGLQKANQLKQVVVKKLRGNSAAAVAIAAAEKGDQQALSTVSDYLQTAMEADPTFAAEVKQLAQQIINIGNIEGRDVFNVSGGQAVVINDAQDKVITAGDHNTFNFYDTKD